MKLILQLLKCCIKRETTYRLNFFLLCLAVTPIQIVQLFFAYIIAKKIDGIFGWYSKDLLFLYSLFMVSYSLAQVFFRHFRFLDRMVITGTLDQYCLKPQPLLFSLVFYNIHIMEIVSQFFPSLILLIFSIVNADIEFNIVCLLVMIGAILGGTMIQSSIFVLMGSMSFFTLKANWIGEFYYSFRDYMSYPISIFGKNVLIFLTYVLPLAFISYYPARFILKKEDMYAIENFLTLPVGVLCLILINVLWKIAIKKYNSVGN